MQTEARPRVLVLLATYLPGYRAGGPIRSIANLVDALAEEFEFRIITADRDLGSRRPYPSVVPRVWTPVGNASVMYLRPAVSSLATLVRTLRRGDYDVLYLNSFFARWNSILPIMLRRLSLLPARPLILAPRGEFSPGALGLKPRRKRAFIRLSKILGLHRGASFVWHASTDHEVDDVVRVFVDCDVDVAVPIPPGSRAGPSGGIEDGPPVLAARDLPDVRRWSVVERPPKPAGTLRAIFLSRICRKKNLLGALTMLRRVCGRVELAVYGPIEDADYWSECERAIDGLPMNVVVRYRGSIAHEEVAAAFAGSDLFLFPTLGENYGHVIIEALAAGCPVLTSGETPWTDLEQNGAGWAVPLSDEDRFVEILEQCAMMGDEDHRAVCERAGAYGQRRAADQGAVDQHRHLFNRARGLGNGQGVLP